VSSIPSAIVSRRALSVGHKRCVEHNAGGCKGKGGKGRAGRDIRPPKGWLLGGWMEGLYEGAGRGCGRNRVIG